MIAARELVASGVPSGTVVYADHQVSGRGRLPGRTWVCKPGDGLLFTMAVTEARPVGAPLRAGLAVALAIKHFSAAAALPGAVFSIWHNLSGATLAYFWSRKH